MGEFSILTGETGSGKTTFLTQLSLDFMQQRVPTLWGSFEIKNDKLVSLFLMQLAKKNLRQAPVKEIEYYAEILEKLPLYLLKFHGSQSLDEIMNTMNYAVYNFDIQNIVLDNLQFMVGVPTKQVNKFDYQDEIIHKIRKFATEKNIHLTLVIHPKKTDEALKISSIFGTAKASQEADNIYIIQAYKGIRIMEIAKNRFDGATGKVALAFDSEACRYFELTEEEFNNFTKGVLKIEDIISNRIKYHGKVEYKKNEYAGVNYEKIIEWNKPENISEILSDINFSENKKIKNSEVGLVLDDNRNDDVIENYNKNIKEKKFINKEINKESNKEINTKNFENVNNKEFIKGNLHIENNKENIIETYKENDNECITENNKENNIKNLEKENNFLDDNENLNNKKKKNSVLNSNIKTEIKPRKTKDSIKISEMTHSKSENSEIKEEHLISSDLKNIYENLENENISDKINQTNNNNNIITSGKSPELKTDTKEKIEPNNNINNISFSENKIKKEKKIPKVKFPLVKLEPEDLQIKEIGDEIDVYLNQIIDEIKHIPSYNDYTIIDAHDLSDHTKPEENRNLSEEDKAKFFNREIYLKDNEINSLKSIILTQENILPEISFIENFHSEETKEKAFANDYRNRRKYDNNKGGNFPSFKYDKQQKK